MGHYRKTICIVFPMLLWISFQSFSQNIEQNDSADIKLKKAAREIMTAAGTCALITLGEDDLPMVRTMDPFLPDSNFTVWFGTTPKSRKVDQIKKNPNVALYYIDSDASGYVVIHGVAQLVDDQKEKEKRWKAGWETFYPDKKEDYMLIKVTPDWMEIISVARGILGDTKTWQPPKVIFKSK